MSFAIPRILGSSDKLRHHHIDCNDKLIQGLESGEFEVNRTLLIGALAGVLITAGLALYVKEQNLLSGGAGSIVAIDGSTLRDPENAPLVTTLSQFSAAFPGSGDLLMRRTSQLLPQTTPQAWEKAMSESGLLVNQRTTAGCRSAELSTAITIRPEQTRLILAGQINVLFLANDALRCFSTQSKAILVVDDPVDAKLAYDMPAVVQIERLIELPMLDIRDQILQALRITKSDLPYLAFGSRGLVNLSLNVTIIHFTLLKEKPILDPRQMPPFMAGVEAIRPAALQSHLRSMEAIAAPVLLDTRDPRNRSAGTLAGAISAPFIATDERQLKFLIDMPMNLAAGGRFDTSKLPEVMATPLILFGNDEQDASVFWVARNLKLLGYRRVFFIIGGLKALKKEAPNFKL